jgi:two-component system response regulator HupR/HoxA
MQPAPSPPSAPVPGSRPHRILVVDDEPDVAEALRGLLAVSLDGPLNIKVAGSAEEASRAARDERFDLVLCDYKLPGKTGVELLAELRERQPETRRILITAYADVGVAMHAINEAGVDNFIEKPFEPEQVVQRVQELLEDKRAREFREQAFNRALDALRARVDQGTS